MLIDRATGDIGHSGFGADSIIQIDFEFLPAAPTLESARNLLRQCRAAAAIGADGIGAPKMRRSLAMHFFWCGHDAPGLRRPLLDLEPRA